MTNSDSTESHPHPMKRKRLSKALELQELAFLVAFNLLEKKNGGVLCK